MLSINDLKIQVVKDEISIPTPSKDKNYLLVLYVMNIHLRFFVPL